MKKIICLLLFLSPWITLAQTDPGLTNHKIYLDLLNHSRDSLYEQALQSYNRFIQLNNGNFKVQIERCRFIGSAYYDYSEDYNPKYDEADQCARELVAKFPNNPEALLLRAEYLFGDSSISFLKKAEYKIDHDTLTWRNYSWKVYQLLAEAYENDSSEIAIQYGLKAMERNDTIDLTLLVGKLYKVRKLNKSAIEMLSSKLEQKQNSWSLNEKGKLLLEMGATDKAIQAFHLAKKDSTGWQESGLLGEALLDKGLVTEARDYLAKEARRTWRNERARFKLFDYDIKYSIADSAVVSYQLLTKDSFWNDPIGIARIRLLFKAPFAHFSGADMSRILLLIAIIVSLTILPYLWILPLHYYGKYVRKSSSTIQVRWGMRHLWLAFSIWLLADFFALAVYDYASVIAIFNQSISEASQLPVSQARANVTALFLLILFVLTVSLFLKRTDFQTFFQNLRTRSREVFTGIGLAFALRFALGIYVTIVNRLGWFPGSGFLSINEDIMSINKYYHPFWGFLFVVILVPIYEEILFRGVFLTSCKKYLSFVIANVLQSGVFALAHQNLKLFPFYFAFGIVAGLFQNRSQSLATGLVMHMTNNFIAFMMILTMQRSMM